MDFYVYTLADPRDGAVFYVGKGQRNRAWQHTEHVRRGGKVSNAAKTDRIKEILRSRHEPAVAIVKRFTSENEALRLEAELIDWMGKLCDIQSELITYYRGLLPSDLRLPDELRAKIDTMIEELPK